MDVRVADPTVDNTVSDPVAWKVYLDFLALGCIYYTVNPKCIRKNEQCNAKVSEKGQNSDHNFNALIKRISLFDNVSVMTNT